MPYKTEKPILIADCETTPNYFALGVREIAGSKRTRVFELSDRSTIDWEKISRIFCSYTVVGYNWHTFDKPILRWAVENPWCSTENLKDKAQTLIGERVRWWEAERRLGIEYPWSWDSIDLIEPQPNPSASLKTLNGRMHGRWMQELPYAHDAILTHSQMDETNTYMLNDLAATEALWEILREPMALREAMGETIWDENRKASPQQWNAQGVDLRSKSDTQMGMAIVKHRVETALGRRVFKKEADLSQTFSYEPPAYLQFETPILRDMLDQLRIHQFKTDPKSGKANLPDFLLRPVQIGSTTYAMGIGGLHSTEASRAVIADADYVLVDADVGSYYPNIELSLGLYPAAIGPKFIDVGRGIMADRMAAKAAAKAAKKDGRLADVARFGATEKGLKIAMNGGMFGNLGSPYAIVYAPHLLLAVTITGQLALLMLIERAEASGIHVVSANTDGVVFRCPRSMYAGIDGDRLLPSRLAEVTAWWEQATQFALEFVEYRAVYSRDVNTYIALKANGGHKRKGPVSNPWNSHPDDWNPFYGGQLMKNPQATVCGDAVLALLKDGTPIEQTIHGCRDIRQFVTVIKVTPGAVWGQGDAREIAGCLLPPEDAGYLGKVVRYYWGVNGRPIYEAKPNAGGNHKQVPKTEGSRPCMTLPDELPADIDHGRYIAEAREILRDIGYFGRPIEPPKFGNLAAWKKEMISTWSLVA